MSSRERNRSRRLIGRQPARSAVLAACAVMALAACSAGPEPRGDVVPAAGGDVASTAGGSRSPGSGVMAEQVSATVETEPVPHGGDAADDPAVWVDPADPSMSAIIGTDKEGGLAVYDLAGRQLQYLPAGSMNNVDVRPAADAFTVGGRPVVLVVAGNRSSNSIDVFALDPATRRLRDVGGDAIEPDLEIYGSCLYRSAGTGKVYVFVNSKAGDVEQWELADDGSGRVVGQRV